MRLCSRRTPFGADRGARRRAVSRRCVSSVSIRWCGNSIATPWVNVLVLIASITTALGISLRVPVDDGRPDLVPAAREQHAPASERGGAAGDAVLAGMPSQFETEEDFGVNSTNCARRSAWTGPDLSNPMTVVALQNWAAIPIQSYAAPLQPKPAFLMMIYRRIAFGHAWETFFRRGGNRTSTLLIHSKTPSPEIPDFFKPYLMWEDVPTARCHDANLMLRMIGLALADESVSHFVFVSGDTLPVKTLSYISGDLAESPSSRFCVDSEWSRAETWFMMERKHAQLFVNHQAQLRLMIPYSDCEDEDLFFWPLHARQEVVVDKCMMMTDWSRTEKFWSQKTAKCDCPEFLDSTKTPGNCGTPSVFHDVDKAGLDSLMHSKEGYWFARKFLGDGIEGTTTYESDAPLDKEITRRLKVKAKADS